MDHLSAFKGSVDSSIQQESDRISFLIDRKVRFDETPFFVFDVLFGRCIQKEMTFRIHLAVRLTVRLTVRSDKDISIVS